MKINPICTFTLQADIIWFYWCIIRESDCVANAHEFQFWKFEILFDNAACKCWCSAKASLQFRDHISHDLSKDTIESRGKSDISLDHEYFSAFRALLGDDSFVYIVRQREYTAAGTWCWQDSARENLQAKI